MHLNLLWRCNFRLQGNSLRQGLEILNQEFTLVVQEWPKEPLGRRMLCLSRPSGEGGEEDMRGMQWRMVATSFHRLLVLAMSRDRRAKSSAQLPSRPCPLYATIFHATTKDRIAGDRMWNGCCFLRSRCPGRLRQTSNWGT